MCVAISGIIVVFFSSTVLYAFLGLARRLSGRVGLTNVFDRMVLVRSRAAHLRGQKRLLHP